MSLNVFECLFIECHTDTLGIEAVRKSILREIRKTLNAYGLYVNYRHLGTLVDVMTSRGHIMSITRHGTNRVDHGAIQRASNEETVELLFDSACHAERDQFLGVSNNVLLGQLCPIGTGLFDMLLDDKMLEINPTFTGESTFFSMQCAMQCAKTTLYGGLMWWTDGRMSN